MSMFTSAQEFSISGGNFNATNITHNYGAPAPHTVSEEDAGTRVLGALPGNNFRGIHRDKLAKRAPSTGLWFLQTVLALWFLSKKQKLWLRGGPGTGKTTLLALAVDDLEKRATETEGMSVCYCYCDHVNKKATVADVLMVLLRQHIERDGDASFVELVDKALKRHKRENTQLSQSELERLLKAIIQRRPTFYLLDALDEFPSKLRISLVRSLSSLGARLVITSRIDKRAEKRFDKETTFCEVHARDVDIDRLLDDRITNSLELEDVIGESHLREEIRSTIKANCNGMFLHAALQVDTLRGCKTIEAVRKALVDFPHQINAFYGDAVHRIRANVEDAAIATLGLVCLLTTLRSITIQDLQYVLAFDHDASSPFDTDRVLPEATLLSLFCGLVAVDKETQFVGFIHATAREFLMEQMKSDPVFKRRHDILARACIARLESLNMHCSTIHSMEEYDRAMSDHPLLAYADETWSKHTHEGKEPATHEVVARFISQCESYPVRWDNVLDHWSGIHLAAYWNIPHAVETALPHTLLARTTVCCLTPLILASSAGHLEMARAILQSTVDPNGQDYAGWTALSYASHDGHIDIVRLLVAAPGILLDQTTTEGYSALMLASHTGHTDVVRFLLAAPGIAVHQGDEAGWTALMLASQDGHIDIVRLLVAAPGNLLNQTTPDGHSALILASQNGHVEVVRLLVAAPGILVNQAQEDGWTALTFASQNGHIDIVRLLVAAPGILLNQTTPDGYSVLMLASQNGHADITRLLLEAGGILVDPHERRPRRRDRLRRFLQQPFGKE